MVVIGEALECMGGESVLKLENLTEKDRARMAFWY